MSLKFPLPTVASQVPILLVVRCLTHLRARKLSTKLRMVEPFKATYTSSCSGVPPVAPYRACGMVCVTADLQEGRTLFELPGECQH